MERNLKKERRKDGWKEAAAGVGRGGGETLAYKDRICLIVLLKMTEAEGTRTIHLPRSGFWFVLGCLEKGPFDQAL
jgi:DNA invertase Pin-like site-specific DNA recombinase